MSRRPPGGTPATVALARARIEFSLHAYPHDPRSMSYGLEAAQALGLDLARVFKTLIASVDPAAGPGGRAHLVVAVVPVSGQLDLKALARAFVASRATMADVGAAERATGYVVGGISPIGQKRVHPTVVDVSALHHPTVFVSAGRRGLDLELAPADLVRITEAITERVGR